MAAETGKEKFFAKLQALIAEAGSADLAVIESEIKQLDTEIYQRVYELYGLTENEIKIVEKNK